MNSHTYSIQVFVVWLIVLISLSIFFSLAEAAMLSVNRYRLRHLARQNNRLAKQVQKLLERPDRLLGVILLCDTFADIFASAIATVIAVHYYGDNGVLIATAAMTTLVLIFGEIAPKTVATIYPQQIAFIAVLPLTFLLKLTYPIVWTANTIANGFLRLFGVKVSKYSVEHLSHEELVTLLKETGSKIQADYLNMLLRILDLEKVCVEDIMIPRNEIVGIDLNQSFEDILKEIPKMEHIRLPVYNDDIDQVVGFLHLRTALHLMALGNLTKETLLENLEEPYYIPEGTELNIQLINFRQTRKRVGLIINEYGDIKGLLALEDILEEIVGEYTTNIAAMTNRMIRERVDGSFIVDGSIPIRDLNRYLHSHLPTDGPKTLSGLIIEYLEAIPQSPTSMRLADLEIEVLEVQDNIVKEVRVFSKVLPKKSSSTDQ